MQLLNDRTHHNGSEGRAQDYAYVTKQPWYSGASSSLPILAHVSVRGSRMALVDAYIIEGLRLRIAWSMMKTDPYP